MSRNLAPDTNNLSSHQSRIGNTIGQVRGAMPLHATFDFSHEGVADAREVRILPRASGGFPGTISIPFRLFDNDDPDWSESSNYVHEEFSEWRLDLNDFGIDLANRKSGRVDINSLALGIKYLVWAFLDKQLNFLGFGLTRKPATLFSAIGGGVAIKGQVGATFTVPLGQGFLFTVGARLVIRNQIGTGPLYEWNWATITAVASTVVTVDMDNVASYGTNITGVSAAPTSQILQWNMFRPWVATSTAQTLYAPFFNLMGELYTAPAAATLFTVGDIVKAYKSSEEWREIIGEEQLVLATPGTAFARQNRNTNRFIPLWAAAIVVRVTMSETVALQTILSVGFAGGNTVTVFSQVLTFLNENTGIIGLTRYGQYEVFSTQGSGHQEIQIESYYVPGGMYA